MNQDPQILPTNYQIKFVFNDGQDLNVNVEANFLTQFFDDLSNKKIYWNQAKTAGFWTNLDDVRFVQINLLMPQTNRRVEKIEAADSASNSAIPSDPEQPTERKAEAVGA